MVYHKKDAKMLYRKKMTRRFIIERGQDVFLKDIKTSLNKILYSQTQSH